MMRAAVVSSLRVLRIRDCRRCSGSLPSAATSGIMLTPVSKPDRPSTSSGNASRAGPARSPNPPPVSASASVQTDSAPAVVNTSVRPTAMMTALSTRKTPTSGMATMTASLNPSRNTPPRTTSSATVRATSWPCRACGKKGFSTTCTEASAVDRVIVMIHEVATKPSRTSTNSLPHQNGNRSSSIATDPAPCGLSFATRRYIGSIPSRVKATISSVASGETAPAASAAMAGDVGQAGEVVDPRQAHHLPPRMRLRMPLPRRQAPPAAPDDAAATAQTHSWTGSAERDCPPPPAQRALFRPACPPSLSFHTLRANAGKRGTRTPSRRSSTIRSTVSASHPTPDQQDTPPQRPPHVTVLPAPAGDSDSGRRLRCSSGRWPGAGLIRALCCGA